MAEMTLEEHMAELQRLKPASDRWPADVRRLGTDMLRRELAKVPAAAFKDIRKRLADFGANNTIRLSAEEMRDLFAATRPAQPARKE
ncbi:MAG TPA: hypothetical protein VEI97_14660 [bacterium]|nr:hypothetical protein [bacterium]